MEKQNGDHVATMFNRLWSTIPGNHDTLINAIDVADLVFRLRVIKFN